MQTQDTTTTVDSLSLKLVNVYFWPSNLPTTPTTSQLQCTQCTQCTQTCEESYIVSTTAGTMWSLRVLSLYMPHIREDLLLEMIECECNRRQQENREIPLREVACLSRNPAKAVKTQNQHEAQPALSRSVSSNSLSVGRDGDSQSLSGDVDSLSQSCSALVAVESEATSQSSAGRRMTWGTVKQSLDSCHRAHLVKRIHHLECKVESLQKKLKASQREQRLQLVRHGAALQKHHSTDDLLQSDDFALQISKAGLRLTKRGFVAMGIRKALALTSAVAFPLVTLVETSRQTVTRSEVSVWTMLVARSAAWHKLVYDSFRRFAAFLKTRSGETDTTDPDPKGIQIGAIDIDDGDAAIDIANQCIVSTSDLCLPVKWSLECSQGLLSIGGTAFSGDATNSGIWRRNKLQSLLVTSAVLVDVPKLQHRTWWTQAYAHHTTVHLGHKLCYIQFVLYCIVFVIYCILAKCSTLYFGCWVLDIDFHPSHNLIYYDNRTT